MKNENLVPKVRFKGFSDPWEQRKLGNISIIKGRLGWKSLKQEEYTSSGPSMIAGRHIVNGEIDWGKVDHIPEWRYQESPEIALKNNDVIFSKDGSLDSTMMLVRTDNSINSGFFYEILLTEQFQRLIYLKVSGSSIPHLFQADMNNFEIMVPTHDEQDKITNILFKLDSLIAANEDKLEQLKTLKKLMMQKIFSQEWRFKGFTDPWEQRKLESVVIVYDKGRVPVTSTERISGDTPYYGANGIQDYVDGYTHDGEFTLIAEDGANDTRNYPIKLVNNHAHVLAGKQNILNTRFLSFSLQQINIEPFLSGSGRAKLNASEMKKLLIAVPNIYEQIKVENFLGEMAHLIAANEDKLNQLKELKKYLMQNMFV
ncbi:restriction endonuclease subunit S [Lactiplantibacillus plantarum]|uniref:restriction endonuclease subunit S n=1 Tax=Lactiplantibacillus plantarum TaxID=1590 RepID=UPI001C6943B4|nr:restriction endonuclease subunit S [Lactiplantibacillus plantarum]QYN62078.1 restriction endonuclease subunit S [Lactiplantibacillus plantarum]